MGNPGSTHNRLELVTDDAKRLADHIEKATSERLAPLDPVAKHAAHEDMINFCDYVTDVDVEELERPTQGYEGSQKHSDLCKNRRSS